MINVIRNFKAKASAWKEKSEILYELLCECSRGMETLDKTEDDPVSLVLLRRKSAPYSMVGYDSCCFGGCGGDKKCRVCLGNPTGCDEEAWEVFKKIWGDSCSLSKWIEFKLEQGIKFRRKSKMEMLQERIDIEKMELNELGRGER